MCSIQVNNLRKRKKDNYVVILIVIDFQSLFFSYTELNERAVIDHSEANQKGGL